MANQTALERQIEAVRDALVEGDGRLPRGRAGNALVTAGVINMTGFVTSLAVGATGELRSFAYAWCVANGLQAEADAFNARRQQAYTARTVASLLANRRSLLERLAANRAALIENGYVFGEGES